MNYTENYQLPQWEETDRVLMEDFNDAMAKVDAGMEMMGNGILIQKIICQTLETAASQLVLEISAFDLSQYSHLEFYARGGTTLADRTLLLQINGDTGNHYDYCALDSSLDYTGASWPICGSFGNNTAVKGSLLPTGTGGNLAIQWSSVGYSNNFPFISFYGGMHKNLLFSAISSLRFFASEGDLTQGTTVILYGFKQ